jgi:transcriptional regulator
MYTPEHFAEARPDELRQLIRAHPLGMLVTHGARGLDANHLPCLLDAAPAGSPSTLLAHVARANPLWREVADGDAVLVVFRGPQGYVSPNWYPGKQDDPAQVPTWNYEVVHAHGRIRVRDEEAFVRGVVARLTRTHEASQPEPWKISDAPADYLSSQLANIVGLEIPIERLEGKRKLSQNREARDALGAAGGLEASAQHDLAAAIRGTRAAGEM